MATQLQIVNDVLEKLREDTVTSVNDNAYSKLVGMFVNDAKADMEDVNHEWSVYITEVDTTILSDGTRTYDLTGTNDRSWLIRDGKPGFDQIPSAYDITSGEVGQLFDCPLKLLQRERALTNDILDVEAPKVFAIASDSDGRGWTLTLLWGANTTRSWRTYWYIPQADLLRDGTADNTEIKLPRNPIYQRALYYALNERGEEMGMPGGIAWERSKLAISAALESDMQVQKKSDELDITNLEHL